MNLDPFRLPRQQSYGGVHALRVKAGKGAKARMAPFGDMLWARQIAELWLCERESGPVFTRMRQGRGDMRNGQSESLGCERTYQGIPRKPTLI